MNIDPSQLAPIKLDANECYNEWNSNISTTQGIDLWRYPLPDALVRLKCKLKDFNCICSPAVSLGNGSDDLIFRLLFTCRGQHVLIFRPSYPFYAKFALMNGCKVTGLGLESDYSLPRNFLSLVKEISPDIVFISYPNNPTGNAFDSGQICLAIEENPKTIFVIDEAYYEFFGKSFISLVEEGKRNIVILRTFSKAWGLAGIRFGYAITCQELSEQLDETMLPYHINAITLSAAEAALSNSTSDRLMAIVQRTIGERERIRNELRSNQHLEIFPSVTNFLWIRDPANILFDHLKRCDVKVRILHELHSGIRVTVGKKMENDYLIKCIQSCYENILA